MTADQHPIVQGLMHYAEARNTTAMPDTRYLVTARKPGRLPVGEGWSKPLCSAEELEPTIARLLANGYVVLGVQVTA